MWILSFAFLPNAAPKLLIFNQRNAAETEETRNRATSLPNRNNILTFKLKFIKLVPY